MALLSEYAFIEWRSNCEWAPRGVPPVRRGSVWCVRSERGAKDKRPLGETTDLMGKRLGGSGGPRGPVCGAAGGSQAIHRWDVPGGGPPGVHVTAELKFPGSLVDVYLFRTRMSSLLLILVIITDNYIN